MVVEDIKRIKSGRSELRKFGLTVGAAFCILGALFLWRGKAVYPYLFGIGGAVFVLGLAVPAVLKPLQKAWMALAIVLGWIMTRVILSILFFVMVTPIGLVSRLFGKDFLSLRFDEETKTYWVPKETEKTGHRDYENQF